MKNLNKQRVIITLTIPQLLLIFSLQLVYNSIFAQDYVFPLYTGEIPNANKNIVKEKIEKKDIQTLSNIQTPDIAVYLPSKKFATGQAVIICPGGGYWILAYDWEGTDIAKYLNSIGVAAIVLKYRLPTTGNSIIPHKTPLLDAQRAMRLVRFNAAQWNINPQKIGIMGFSAGGHLASTLGTHFDYGDKAAADFIEQQSCRPDFMILVYPVITFVDACCHTGSRDALLGKGATKELINFYSNELQVKEDTPPTFLIHGNNDIVVPVENALLMYRALKAKKISSEMHILSEGDHGFGLALNNPHVQSWTSNLTSWLKSLK